MTTIAKSTAFVATFAFALTVCISNALAAPKNCPTMTSVSVNGEQVELPAEAAEQVTMLQQYGARYARVIDLILVENAKPDWTFKQDCFPEGADVLALTE